MTYLDESALVRFSRTCRRRSKRRFSGTIAKATGQQAGTRSVGVVEEADVVGLGCKKGTGNARLEVIEGERKRPPNKP